MIYALFDVYQNIFDDFMKGNEKWHSRDYRPTNLELFSNQKGLNFFVGK